MAFSSLNHPLNSRKNLFSSNASVCRTEALYGPPSVFVPELRRNRIFTIAVKSADLYHTS